MNTMKKFLAVLLSAAMVASLAACAGKNPANAGTDAQKTSSLSAQSEAETQPDDAADGGWEYNQGKLSLDQNAEAKAAFDKATEGLVGCGYEPIALIGSQVAAGTNYCILCKSTPVYPDAEASYVLLYVYADLDGKAEITDIRDFAGTNDSDEPIVGGLEMNQGEASVDKNADVKAAFDKALDGLVGCSYETVAYIGSQVVSGTNYVILCRTTPVCPGAESTFSLVTIYEDLSGNAKLTDVTELDLADNTKSSASPDAQTAEEASSQEPAANAAASGQSGSRTAAKPARARTNAKTAAAVKAPAVKGTPAVSADEQSGGDKEDVTDGGWEYNQEELSLDKNAEAKAAFDKATEGLVGCGYEPIALIGSQVAAGTNYCILCKSTPVYPDAEASYVLLYVYADLDGKAEITDIRDFAGTNDSDEPIVGGLEMNQGEASVDKNADVKAAFDKALDGLVGCSYETVAYIGSQVVSGTNYVILCRTTPVCPGAESAFSMVTVYEDLSGNAELADVTDLAI